MNNIQLWITHLHHPLVLAGFGLFLFALIIKPLFLNNSKLTGTATERLLRRAMILLFLLAAMAVAGGIALSWKSSKGEEIAPQNSGDKTAAATVEQATQGTKSPTINSGKDARINYGSTSSGQKQAADKPDAGTQERQAVPSQVKQTTQGEKSPAINAQGNVEVNYAE